MTDSYRGQVNKLAKKFNLPSWWVQSVIVEYFPCRKFLENESLWSFDFKLVHNKLISTLPQKDVVIPEYHMAQNIRPEDFRQRLLLTAYGGSPVADMDEKDLFPEGILNSTCFPVLGNSIDIWDPKLNFNTVAIVLDNRSFYQWKIAELYNINECSSWFKSALFDLVPMFDIYQKIIEYNKSDILKNPTKAQREKVQLYYEELEEARKPLRRKIWEYHINFKNGKRDGKIVPSKIPRFTILDSFRFNGGGYQIYSPIEPLFYRAAFRNCKLAKMARDDVIKTNEVNAIHKEVEYSLMTIISAASCLESYINMIIEKYPTKSEYRKLKDHKKKWLLVSRHLNAKHPFEENKQPFSDFDKIVDLRNDAMHYTARFRPPVDNLTPLYDSYRYIYIVYIYIQAELAVKTMDSMIEHLGSNIPLPKWLMRFRGSIGYWDDAFS
jgi:hypothetical protein